ncbi:MAG: type II toxin-antitoxin system HicB family antitoxin [Thermosynechococcaceae cyanobacterium]
MRYLVIVEETSTGYSAYSPDVPGCVSTGETQEQVEENMQEALAFHIEGLQLEGLQVPVPSTRSTYLTVAA